MDGLNPIAPELADIEHVGLVHRAEPAAAAAGQVEAHPGDAIDLPVEVGHGVEGPHGPIGLHPPLGGTEVHAAGELAHHQQIDPLDHLRPQAAGADQGRNDLDGPQVGEQSQAGAQRQQAAFGSQFPRQAVAARIADRGQQHRIGLAAGLQGALGQGNAVGVDRRCTDRPFVVAEAEAMANRHRIQQLAGHRRDLRADAIARQERDPVAGHQGGGRRNRRGYWAVPLPSLLASADAPSALALIWRRLRAISGSLLNTAEQRSQRRLGMAG